MMAAKNNNSILRGEMLLNEPMRRHTSWRIGGPADRFYKPADIEDLAEFLSQISASEPLTWLGLGSNLLVRDGGIRGTVVATSGLLNSIEQIGDTLIRVEAGVSCAKVARFTTRLSLVGAEFLAGIPGTLGGALAMNAGAFGGETWELVESVETMDHAGLRQKRLPKDYQVGYRSVKGPAGEWFIAANLRLKTGNGELAAERIKALLERRNLTQPTNKPNAGSVFRNPPGDHAARLIESAGLKGYCLGRACVSDKHANFIINTGDATASEVEALISYVAAQVKERFGVCLQREVHIVGDPV